MRALSSRGYLAYALVLTLVGSVLSVILPASQPSYASHENITINFALDDVDEIYGQGDTIVIEGTIEDVVEDEDVTIRVLNPAGTEEDEVDITPDEDDGYFDFTFDIPNDADGGIWTIEVTYDGEETFSYFMVEYDEDEVVVITVVLDATDGMYQAGDEVTIEGSVEEVDPDEEFVTIIVLDPDNGEFVDEDQVELGEGTLDDDEFEFSFDLDDAHGRYAVMVTYDVDDQEGAAVFEVEDEDEGSGGGGNGDSDSDGDLSAELDEEIYELGDPVVVTGTIDNYDDTVDLGIIVKDPDGEEIEAEDNADVDEDGTDGIFEFEFDLDDDAEEGEYTVIITYDNDEVELNFEVEGDGTGSSNDMTVSLNKASYLAGETMTVTGTVPDVADPEDGEQVSIFAYRPAGQVILAAGSSKYVTPSSNGEYSTTIVLPSDLDPDDDFTVKASYLGDTVEALFDITGVSEAPSDEISVETDEEEYSAGQTVEISGTVPENMIVEGQTAFLRVDKPDGSPCRTDQIDIPSSGEFSYSMPLGGNCGVAGEYEVVITYNGNDGAAMFELIGSSVSRYSLNVDGETYQIDYEITSGSINNMFARPSEDKLVITLNADQDGQLTLVLPREVIDAIDNGQDIAYMVTSESDSGDVVVLDADESENTDEVRTLVIDYQAGTGRIEITGTQVVPEFGAIAGIIMAIAIVGIIVASARHGKFSLFRH